MQALLALKRYEIYVDIVVRLGIHTRLDVSEMHEKIKSIIKHEFDGIADEDKESIKKLEDACRIHRLGVAGSHRSSFRNLLLITRFYRLALDSSARKLEDGRTVSLRATAEDMLELIGVPHHVIDAGTGNNTSGDPSGAVILSTPNRHALDPSVSNPRVAALRAEAIKDYSVKVSALDISRSDNDGPEDGGRVGAPHDASTHPSQPRTH